MFFSLKMIAKRKLLARQLKDADSETRTAAVEELGELGEAADVDVIAPALKDEDISVRKAAAQALSRIGDHKAVAPLTECITDRSVSRGAWQTEILLALESLNDPRSVEGCTQALTSSNAKVRRAAASALGNLGQPSAIPALIATMMDQDSEVVRQAGYALTKLGSSAVDPLIKLLEIQAAVLRRDEPFRQRVAGTEERGHLVAEIGGSLVVGGREKTEGAVMTLGGITGFSHHMLKLARHFLYSIFSDEYDDVARLRPARQ